MLFVSFLFASAFCLGEPQKFYKRSNSDASTRASSDASVRSFSSASSVSRIAAAESAQDFDVPANNGFQKLFEKLQPVIEAALEEQKRFNELSPEDKEKELYKNSTEEIEFELDNLKAIESKLPEETNEELLKFLDEQKQYLEALLKCEDYTERQEFIENKAYDDDTKAIDSLLEDLKKVDESKMSEEDKKFLDERYNYLVDLVECKDYASRQKFAQEKAQEAAEAVVKEIEEEIERWDSLTEEEREDELYKNDTEDIDFELEVLDKVLKDDSEMSAEVKKNLIERKNYLLDLVEFTDLASRQKFALKKAYDDSTKAINLSLDNLDKVLEDDSEMSEQARENLIKHENYLLDLKDCTDLASRQKLAQKKAQEDAEKFFEMLFAEEKDQQ